MVAAGDVVTLTQATAALGSLTVNGTLTFAGWDACVNATTVTIASGGLATSVGPFKDEADKTRVYFACTDLTVAKGGRIDVSAQGSPFSGFNSSWSAASGGGGRIAMWVGGGDTNATICAKGGAVSGASSPPTAEQQGYAGEDGTAHWYHLYPLVIIVR